MSKSHLIQENQLENITTERHILREAGPHPFVVKCYEAFQTSEAVVLVLEYVNGGDLYDLLKVYGCLGEEEVRFYLAEVVIGVGELHRRGFVFRDLKLENILVDKKGHVRLTDFGLGGRVVEGDGDEGKGKGWVGGTAIYWSPEVCRGEVGGRGADWWALGVLGYVLLTGRGPFGGGGAEERKELMDAIMGRKLDLEGDERLKEVGGVCKDLLRRLLCKDLRGRLGSGAGDVEEVMKHEFFKGIDWEVVGKYGLKPPLGPPLKGGVGKGGEKIAREKFSDKLGRKYKKRRGKRCTLGDEDYKSIEVRQQGNGRISIGLDFDRRNFAADRKTWTEDHGDDPGHIAQQA